MDKTERTTIRIKEYLMKQSRDIAHERGISLQEVINMLIAKGLAHVTDYSYRKEIGRQVDILRDEISKNGSDFSDIYKESKKDLK